VSGFLGAAAAIFDRWLGGALPDQTDIKISRQASIDALNQAQAQRWAMTNIALEQAGFQRWDSGIGQYAYSMAGGPLPDSPYRYAMVDLAIVPTTEWDGTWKTIAVKGISPYANANSMWWRPPMQRNDPAMYNPAYSRQPDDGIVDAEFEELPQLAIESKD